MLLLIHYLGHELQMNIELIVFCLHFLTEVHRSKITSSDAKGSIF